LWILGEKIRLLKKYTNNEFKRHPFFRGRLRYFLLLLQTKRKNVRHKKSKNEGDQH
jgi:hypothetical protein